MDERYLLAWHTLSRVIGESVRDSCKQALPGRCGRLHSLGFKGRGSAVPESARWLVPLLGVDVCW